jgi:hypothetical protein
MVTLWKLDFIIMFILGVNCLVCCVVWVVGGWCGNFCCAQMVTSCYHRNLTWCSSSYITFLQELNVTPFILFLLSTTPFVLFNFSKTQTSFCLAYIFWNLIELILFVFLETQTPPPHSSILKSHPLCCSIFKNPNFTSSFIFSKTSPFILLNFLKPKLHFLFHLL